MLPLPHAHARKRSLIRIPLLPMMGMSRGRFIYVVLRTVVVAAALLWIGGVDEFLEMGDQLYSVVTQLQQISDKQ